MLLFVATCFGQSGQAEVRGTVQDPSGLPVAGARIQAQQQATGTRFNAVSDRHGDYSIQGLPAGQYSITADQSGFEHFELSGIQIQAGEQLGLDMHLQLGLGSESATGAPQAPTGEVSYNAGDNQVEALPLDQRNFVPLVALAPGVALPADSSLPRISGGRPRANEYIYDGVSVRQPEPGQPAFYPVIDAIDDLEVNINSYPPDYGRSNGGAVVIGTKSGSNDFHGTAFEFFRNEDLNARNYFASAGTRPEFRHNQFGAAVGGPLQKNKSYFFADWQSTRLRTGITRFSTVPTLAERQGIFSAPIYDPASSPRVLFPNNTIPLTRMDPVALQVLEHYPAPVSSAAANNYSRTATESDHQDQFGIRLDRYMGRHLVFARYTYLRGNDTPATPLPDGSGALGSGVAGHAITRADGLVAGDDFTVSPLLLNQFRLGYSRLDVDQSSIPSGDISIPGIPANPFSSVLPAFPVTGYQQIGPAAGGNSSFTTSVTEYTDTVSLVHGRHTFKFGADIRRETLDTRIPQHPNGVFAFNATGTNNLAVPNSGNALASLLLGQVNAFSIDFQDRPLEDRAHVAEFFAGDDWKATDRLSLSLGTRYTLNFPSTEIHNQGAIFNLNTQILDFPHTARELECCDIGPRAGLAYRIGETWVVRAGYGMTWFGQSGLASPFTLPAFPFVDTVGQISQDNLQPAFVLAQGPAIELTPPNPNSGLGQGVFGVDRNSGSGYSQQWNLTVQKNFGAGQSLEAGYLGSKNTSLGVPDTNINQLPTADLALGPALIEQVNNPYYGQIPASSSLGGPALTEQQLLRPYSRFTTVSLFRDNVGNSTYHAAEARLEERFSDDLTVTVAYTFSKLIDDASSFFSDTIFTGPLVNPGVADAYNRHLEKDLSNGDIPRIFSAGWVYQVPAFWKFSGWEIGGMVRVQSGIPIAVTQGTNFNSYLGFTTQRPNRVSDPNALGKRSVAEWFNTAAFAMAPQFTLGNSSRNPVRGPGLQDADLLIGKTFRINGRFSLELRGEVFNVINTPPLGNPDGVFGTPGFGSITNAGNPRDLEFAAKVHF